MQAPNIPSTKSYVPLSLLRSYQSISPGPRLCLWIFRNEIRFNREELLAPCPPPRLEDHPLSAVRDCLFNIFTATLHIGGHSSIHNLRMHHAVVAGTHLSRGKYLFIYLCIYTYKKFGLQKYETWQTNDNLRQGQVESSWPSCCLYIEAWM